MMQHYTHLQRISTSQEEDRPFPTGDEVGLLPSSPLADGTDSFGSPSPCSPDSKVFLTVAPSTSSFGENDELAYLACMLPGAAPTATMMPMMPQQVCLAPASPGGTSSRSTSPTSWMFHSNPVPTSVATELMADQQPGSQIEHQLGESSGCMYCDQCHAASRAGSIAVISAQPTDEAAFIKQEPLSWLPEEMTSVSSGDVASCGSGAIPFQIAGYSSLEQLPIYTMPTMGLAGPSSPPSVEIALPLEDDWTAFLMDN